jgi:hypothetical protein
VAPLDQKECAHFIASVITAYHRYPPSAIVNFDESNWFHVMADDETVAVRGAETVYHYSNGRTTANFSFFATITAEGVKLPLILITKGKTDRAINSSGGTILIAMRSGILQGDGQQYRS